MPDEEQGGPGRAAPTPGETGGSRNEADVGGSGRKVEARSRISLPETAALFVVLVGLFIFFAITSEFFFNSNNIINILQNVARAGIIACPATILLIAGQFDLCNDEPLVVAMELVDLPEVVAVADHVARLVDDR